MISPTTKFPGRRSAKRGATFVKLTEKVDKVSTEGKLTSTTTYKNVSKKELLRATIYTTVFFVVISLQLDIKETYLQNKSVQNLFYPINNQKGFVKITEPTQHIIQNILDNLIANHFPEMEFGVTGNSFSIKKKIFPISDMRFRINNVKLQEGNVVVGSDIWDPSLSEDPRSFGNNKSFTYSKAAGIFECKINDAEVFFLL
jgi:hypothetical protein